MDRIAVALLTGLLALICPASAWAQWESVCVSERLRVASARERELEAYGSEVRAQQLGSADLSQRADWFRNTTRRLGSMLGDAARAFEDVIQCDEPAASLAALVSSARLFERARVIVLDTQSRAFPLAARVDFAPEPLEHFFVCASATRFRLAWRLVDSSGDSATRETIRDALESYSLDVVARCVTERRREDASFPPLTELETREIFGAREE